MSTTKSSQAGERTQTASDILRQFGIGVEREPLSDGSKVFNVGLRNITEIPCATKEKAEELAFAIAVAIRNFGMI